MAFDAAKLLERSNGPAATNSPMRRTDTAREEAEDAVMRAGGSLTDPVPKWVREDWENRRPNKRITQTTRVCPLPLF